MSLKISKTVCKMAWLALVLLAVPRVAAADSISVRFAFTLIHQGQVGVVLITGTDLTSATATAMGHDYACFPVTQGTACLLAVPMDQPIRDYPLSIVMIPKSGSVITWNSTFTVAAGQFISEIVTLPGNLAYLLRDDVEANENARLASAYSMITPTRYWENKWVLPLVGAPGSPFGTKRLYNGSIARRHAGQDMHAALGTPVLAAASGRVVLSRQMDIHGNSIVIDHGWGIYSEYAHLSRRYVVPGQWVSQGDVIGLSGSSGRSTGPHIHWEVSVDGIMTDPTAFMQLALPS